MIKLVKNNQKCSSVEQVTLLSQPLLHKGIQQLSSQLHNVLGRAVTAQIMEDWRRSKEEHASPPPCVLFFCGISDGPDGAAITCMPWAFWRMHARLFARKGNRPGHPDGRMEGRSPRETGGLGAAGGLFFDSAATTPITSRWTAMGGSPIRMGYSSKGSPMDTRRKAPMTGRRKGTLERAPGRGRGRGILSDRRCGRCLRYGGDRLRRTPYQYPAPVAERALSREFHLIYSTTSGIREAVAEKTRRRISPGVL